MPELTEAEHPQGGLIGTYCGLGGLIKLAGLRGRRVPAENSSAGTPRAVAFKS
jgi:hypothetical protein